MGIKHKEELLEQIESESDRVEIVVRDNGAGMDRDTMSKTFYPFFSSERGRKGYGLGLFIVRNIIEEHGGTISVDSAPGHWTAFTIVLPLKES